MFQNCQDLAAPEKYQLLVNGVVPRPIAWVSTLSEQGISNLSPYSFFSVASVNPPVLTITQVPARNRPHKDTMLNLLATKECVVNVVTEDTAELMNDSCADYPHDTSEIEQLNIETSVSELVKVPGVAAAKMRFECKLRDTVSISDEPAGGTLILLDVLGIYVADELVEDQKIQGAALKAVGKLGGNGYCKLDSTFEMERPTLA
ncbi:flavin reductase family protein [Thiomicrorhabdus sp. 6S2-11]|uniref:Flavin reductase family protein n=1 Tax=Thiomicrorhabdus marina TaxID=2818442 RepID=A0ABS3Q858_9GAMM|nr:flavin reductase family protein [Thiomicrorhabdus marina]MBO1928462.1 flavin reductase family protein [Thiomicrorhabdus marina]